MEGEEEKGQTMAGLIWNSWGLVEYEDWVGGAGSVLVVGF